MTEVALWQYRWLNPGNDTNVTPDMLAWKEVKPWNPRMQTMEQRIEELRSFRYKDKPAYEVRALGVIPCGVIASDARHCGNCADGVPGGPDNCPKCGRKQQYSHWTPRFQKTSCSQCGGEFGPGDQGFSHCADHSKEQAR